jgi:hypothetical protein
MPTYISLPLHAEGRRVDQGWRKAARRHQGEDPEGGKLYRRTGKHQEAQEHLTTATTMYREMDMPYWLEQAKAGTRELG